MPYIPRAEALRRLRATLDAGQPVIGCGAGTGITAKFAEQGGADLIIIYNSGRYRMAGRGSLSGMMPFGDANAIVVDMAAEVLPVVQDTPVGDANAIVVDIGGRKCCRWSRHAGAGGRLRHRSVPAHAHVPAAAQGHGL